MLIISVGNKGEDGAEKGMCYGKKKTATNQIAWAQHVTPPLTNYVILDKSILAPKPIVTYWKGRIQKNMVKIIPTLVYLFLSSAKTIWSTEHIV